MTQNVRIGVIGTSWWSDLMYLPSFQTHPNATVVALCGRNQEPATAMNGVTNWTRY